MFTVWHMRDVIFLCKTIPFLKFVMVKRNRSICNGNAQHNKYDMIDTEICVMVHVSHLHTFVHAYLMNIRIIHLSVCNSIS